MINKKKSNEFVKFFKNYTLTLSSTVDKINLKYMHEAANLILISSSGNSKNIREVLKC